MKEFKYKISFASHLNPLKLEDKDKFISLASKNDNIRKLLPKNSDLSQNIGFLLFSGESFIANQLNANNDGVKTEEAIKIANEFPLTYVDINHKRDRLCGVVIAATYTDYKTGKELLEDEVRNSKDPFSVSITGIVWRAPNPELADAIENMNATDSPLKDSIFLSWELAFDDTELIVMNAKDSKFTDGEFITNTEEINKLSKKLLANGGNGFTEDGKKIGRIAVGDVVVLGVGLVENPAAAVSPIEVEKPTESNATLNTEVIYKLVIDKVLEVLKEQNSDASHEHKTVKCSCGNTISNCRCTSLDKKVDTITNGCRECQKNLKNNENKISQAEKVVVNDNDITKNLIMKIEKFEQITAENLKDVKIEDLKEIYASSTKELLDNKIKEINQDFTIKISEKDKSIEAAQKATESLNKTIEQLNEKVLKASQDLEKIQNENKQREQVEAFSARMGTIEEGFDLDEKQKEIVANKVKTLGNDEEFNKYLAEIDILLAAKKKMAKPTKKNPDPDNDGDDDTSKKGDTDKDNAGKDKKESKASVEDGKAIEDAIKNGKKQEEVLPNAATGAETLAERAKKAFGLDGWTVVNKRKNR